ncbi:uncharacterized protein V2V93DRAFT_368261 [Kockiozyma suomiensis]|uniref:uncharacterized protein n=1 Tax=Kockiozyma suomiensis TaxID=1337062 RepID=UPI003343D98D
MATAAFRSPDEDLVNDTEDQNLKRAEDFILTDNSEIIDIRAFQRTYEGAYMRTAMLELTMGLSVLRLFDIEFYPIGAWFAAIGVAFMGIGIGRRIMSNKFLIRTKPARYFLTSGTPVLFTSIFVIVGYAAMLPEVFRFQ